MLQNRSNRLKASKQERFEQRTVEFIIDTISPISIVEKVSFIRLFEETKLRVISRSKATDLISEMYVTMCEKIKVNFHAIEHICTTADIWSYSKRSFFGYTAHWLNDKFERKSVALSCKRMSGTHSFDKIYAMINEINTTYNIENKVVSVTTDNGSNFVKAFKEFGVEYNAK